LITERGVWYIVENTNGYYWDKNNTRLRFQDGIIITAKGKVINFAKDIPKADKDIKRRVKDYAQLCADAVPLDKPDGGDCWYCYMATDKGQSLGNAIKNVDHLKQHMKDKYIVPSLVYRALEQYYNAKMAFWQAFKDTGYPEDTDREFGKQAVKKAVYRYIMRHFNYAV